MTSMRGIDTISGRIMDAKQPTQRLARLALIALYPLRLLDHATRPRRGR